MLLTHANSVCLSLDSLPKKSSALQKGRMGSTSHILRQGASIRTFLHNFLLFSCRQIQTDLLQKVEEKVLYFLFVLYIHT